MTQRKPETIQALINRTHKVCPICGEDKSLTEYHKDKHDPYGYSGWCKVCRRTKSREGYLRRKDKILAYIKSYRATENGKAKRRRESRNRITNHPDKYKANYLLTNAVRDKRLIPSVCEVCGEIKSQGHHPDYSKPLEVVWLCQKHHQELHNKLREI